MSDYVHRAGAHTRLVAAFFSETPMYDRTRFRKTFRMARPLFNQIVNAVSDHCAHFQSNLDCAGREGISPLINERSSRKALDHFCQAVMEIYGLEYLRKPTVTDVEKLCRHHEEKHGFPGMLGSLDCTNWEWFGCPYAFKAQYVRQDHGSNLFILLESVASQDLWIWHAFFGVDGSNNDINVLYQSSLFNDLKTGRAPEIPFVANGVTYPSRCYLLNGIYPKLATLVKTIPEPADDDHKRILYKKKQESERKDVKRAFGVLKKKWAILANHTRALRKDRIVNMMYTCIILHNMIRKYKEVAISPTWFPKEAHH
nr:protein ALP1-like [Tanacetum cinerariifolium]